MNATLTSRCGKRGREHEYSKAEVKPGKNSRRRAVLPESMTLDEAVEELTDELNCVECIALEQCADCFGEDTRDGENPRCREVVRAYLNQDYKKKEDK